MLERKLTGLKCVSLWQPNEIVELPRGFCSLLRDGGSASQHQYMGTGSFEWRLGGAHPPRVGYTASTIIQWAVKAPCVTATYDCYGEPLLGASCIILICRWNCQPGGCVHNFAVQSTNHSCTQDTHHSSSQPRSASLQHILPQLCQIIGPQDHKSNPTL